MLQYQAGASLCTFGVLTASCSEPRRLQVREEQRRLRPDLEATITGELLAEMQYTRQVVKEVLRYRPPAPMVPQVRGVPNSRCTWPGAIWKRPSCQAGHQAAPASCCHR